MNRKEDSLGFLLGQSTNLIWKNLFRNFIQNGYDVTPEQFSILIKLMHYKILSQKDLAELTCKDKVSITKIITNLEKRDLVTREIDGFDKRVKRISLTPKGKKITPKLKELADNSIKKSFKKIDKKDIEIFKNVLANINLNLSEVKEL